MRSIAKALLRQMTCDGTLEYSKGYSSLNVTHNSVLIRCSLETNTLEIWIEGDKLPDLDALVLDL